MDSAESKACASSYRVVVHVPCVNCRYDLYTLDPESRCPECGESIRPSLVAFAVRVSNRAAIPSLMPIAAKNAIVGILLIVSLMILEGMRSREWQGFGCLMLLVLFPFCVCFPIVAIYRLFGAGSVDDKIVAAGSILVPLAPLAWLFLTVR